VLFQVLLARRGFLARNLTHDCSRAVLGILRVADQTDERPCGDSQKPVVNDNVYYHSGRELASETSRTCRDFPEPDFRLGNLRMACHTQSPKL
jgi:hypothetical protein